MEDLARLLNKIKQYNPDGDLEIVERAYLFAQEAHANQTRLSGEKYIQHPLAVGEILADLKMDVDAICGAILHDVVEDTFVGVDIIRENFGDSIAELVDGVTKIGKLQFSTKEQRQGESLRKMIIAMANDIRVIIIKLGDRLHNMRTLDAMSQEKQAEKATETLEIYAPIAHRLGIFKIKWELEDLALRYLDADAYKDISSKVSLKRQEREAFIENVINKLSQELKQAGIEAKIEGRPKHFYSIYKKMQKGKSFDEIYDLFAVRILVSTIRDCYEVLGMVHTLWNPIPGRFKDYIAMPKPNMYQSLHTTVFAKGSEPFEIQIKTYEMHATAEYGIAAHWKYKEGKKESDEFEKKLTWLRELMEWQSELKDTDEFMETVKIDLFTDEVFAFTPKGKVIQLPQGACPIDLAYRIHSDIGNKCVGAKVNKKMVPLTYKLKNGDIVEILTSSSSKGPSRDWLNVVVSSHAKTKIRSFFKKLDRDDNILRGKEIFERECKRQGVLPSKILSNKYYDFITKRFNVNSWEDIFSSIGYGGIKAGFVIQRVKENFKEDFVTDKIEPEIKLSKNKENSTRNTILIQGHNDFAARFAKCCSPVPGDNIVGYITRGRGVSVHRADCVNIHHTDDEQRLINVSWANEVASKNQAFKTDIVIKAKDRPRLVSEISTLISNEEIIMMGFNAKLDRRDICTISVTIKINSIKELDDLFKKIMSVAGVINVYRI